VAQINLLKQNVSVGSQLQKDIPKFLVRLFLIILVGIIGYYGWLFFQAKSLDSQIAETNVKINSEQQSGLTEKNRNELMTRQQQLKSLNGLVASHSYWSQLFKPLADATLKNASYSNLQVSLDGGLSLSVAVPTLEDLDKYMQIFDLPQFNQNFSNVIIGGFTKVDSKNSTGVQFQAKMKFDPKLIQYKDPNNNAG
jgi:hypothetical protein